MPQSKSMLTQQDGYVPNRFHYFLWWLATAEKELLQDCVIDRNRYSIIGMSVLGTWSFATLAWMYFFSTVVDNAWVVVALGIFMGAIILSIDRALIKGINKQNKKQLLPLLFRGLLAITIGTFMAQPALLYLFNKEVHVQISLDNEQKLQEKRKQQDSLYAQQKNELQGQKTKLIANEQTRYSEVAAARQNFISETDGSGGTKKMGLFTIAKAKQNEYERLDKAYKQLATEDSLPLWHIDSSLNAIDIAKQKEQQLFAQLLNAGFLTRIEALNHLIKNNAALQSRYYLLVAILLLIELMPVIAKMLLPTGTYDAKALAREQLEKETIEEEIANEKKLQQLYNKLALEQDTALIKDFFGEMNIHAKEKMHGSINEWRDKEPQTLSSLWKEIKRRLFTK
ncbi:DUF4407 domain-containing protein [Parasediminibacterium sp. JCM 36343]|uniref:DUF4407 domain-containing protein n=1 Tax=Parasediminibacterium sp. JCM 36343 TaxID=3374279 RepID=UPI00397A6CB3